MTPLLLTVPEAAKMIGFSSRWLYDEIKARRFPAVKIGRSIRVKPSDVEEFVEQAECTIDTNSPGPSSTESEVQPGMLGGASEAGLIAGRLERLKRA